MNQPGTTSRRPHAMNATSETSKNGQTKKRKETEERVDDIELKSSDLKPGQYAARLLGYSPVYELPSKFAKRGQASTAGYARKFDILYAIRTKPEGGVVRVLRAIASPPNGGGISSKSTLHKHLKVVAAGDSDLWDGALNNIRDGVKLSAFTGRTCNVIVEN